MSTSVPAPNVSFFTPMQDPPAGAALEHQPDNKPIPTLFQPLTVRGLTFHNRIFVCYISMCQYSAKDGFITPWHFGHLGGIFTRGPGLSIVEATAIVPEGRITPDDVGIWSDAHTENLKPLVEYAHSQNQKIAIQIGHAGRKASTMAPWIGGNSHAGKESGGWPDNIVGASAIPFDHGDPTPRELSEDELKGVVQAFKDAAIRAVEAGFDVIEIHGAHGYLLSSFLSPTSNHRTDDYGGNFENRIRFPLEVVDAIRSAIPQDMPLFFRLSGSEDIEQSLPDTPSWRIEDTVRFAPILHKHGVDFLDLSSGGLHPKQKHAPASFGPAYQVRFAEAVKRAVPNLIVGCVGRITNGHVAQDILAKGQADAVLVGRGFQISWGFMGRKKEKENAT